MPTQTQPLRRRIVTRQELRERLGGICFATIDNYVKRHILPRPIKFGPNRVGWLESDIDAYFDRLVAERDAGARAMQGERDAQRETDVA